MVTNTQTVDKDAWLLRAIGGTYDYGSGMGDRLTVGPITDISGSPDYQCRIVFEIDLTVLLASITALSAATFTLTVAPESCGTRGTVQRLFLEEVTGKFTEMASLGSDCKFHTGTTKETWPGPDVNTTNRASYSASGKTTGDTVVFDILALMQRKLTEGATVLRFRIIAASLSLGGYHESNFDRTLTFYSRHNATSGNRPTVSITGTTTGTSKSFSESGAMTETFSVTSLGSGTVGVSDSGMFTDTMVVRTGTEWRTVIDSSTGEGHGEVVLWSADSLSSTALLDTVSAADVSMTMRFRLDKVPVGGTAFLRLLARVASVNHCYRAAAQMDAQQSITLSLTKLVSGSVSALRVFVNAETLVIDTDYWMQFEVSDTTLKMRLWRDGASQPAWQINVTDTDISAAGTVGLQGGLNVGATNMPITVAFDDFVVVAP